MRLVNYSVLHIDIGLIMVGMIANISDCKDTVFLSNNNVFPLEIKFSWLKMGISCHLNNISIIFLLPFPHFWRTAPSSSSNSTMVRCPPHIETQQLRAIRKICASVSSTLSRTFHTFTELVATFLAFIQLYALAYTILYCM